MGQPWVNGQPVQWPAQPCSAAKVGQHECGSSQPLCVLKHLALEVPSCPLWSPGTIPLFRSSPVILAIQMPKTGEYYAAIAATENLDKVIDDVATANSRLISATRIVVQRAIKGEQESRVKLRLATEGMQRIHEVYCEIIDKFEEEEDDPGQPSGPPHAGATGSEAPSL